MIHLDTSFLIRALIRGTPENGRLQGWLGGRQEMSLSSVTWAEFLCGPVTPEEADDAAVIFGEPAPFDAMDATLAATLFNAGGRRRRSLSDCMIAAVALNAGATLATCNAGDFERFAPLGLTLVALGGGSRT